MLTVRRCRPYINVKAKFGRSDGHGGLSAVSLRQHKNVLNQTLKLAQRDGLIQTNPADLVVMPHAAQFTGTFYTESQMRDLLTAVKNERLYPIIYVTALYGLRRSEVLGLKWDSINFAMQTLTIRHTVARVTKVVEKNKTKNASSFRSFPLTDDAVRLFKILLQQEQYYRNHFGKDYIMPTEQSPISESAKTATPTKPRDQGGILPLCGGSAPIQTTQGCEKPCLPTWS